jgi:very-long-chain enoyl-CoA reductase
LPGLPYQLTVIPKSAEDLYDQIASVTGFSIHRLRVTTKRDGKGLIANSQDIIDLSETTDLFVKDLGNFSPSQINAISSLTNITSHGNTGPQVSWRNVYIIEYLGPLLLHPIIYILRLTHPTPIQTLLLTLILLHFTKREVETLYIHRFSNATMPLRNIFKNSFHYWVLSGVMLAWSFYTPEDPSRRKLHSSDYLGGFVYLIGELGNLYIHVMLRNLRPQGTTQRQLPTGVGFKWVTCPKWSGILMISRSFAVVMFIAVAVTQMWVWGRKKEMRYRREFPDTYEWKKYVVLPGIC